MWSSFYLSCKTNLWILYPCRVSFIFCWCFDDLSWWKRWRNGISVVSFYICWNNALNIQVMSYSLYFYFIGWRWLHHNWWMMNFVIIWTMCASSEDECLKLPIYLMKKNSYLYYFQLLLFVWTIICDLYWTWVASQ